MSSKAKASPKSSPKKQAAKKSEGGVTKPKTARKAKDTKKATTERFTKEEKKTTAMGLRDGKSKLNEVAEINKTLVAQKKSQDAGKGKKKRLSEFERTALEGSAFALKEAKRKK